MKKLAALLILLLPVNTYAAIAFDNSGKTSGTNTSASLTYTNNGNFIYACLFFADNNCTGLSSMTWNGTTMTAVNRNKASGCVADFYIQNAQTGSHSLSVSWSNSEPYVLGAESYNGVATVGNPIDNNAKNQTDFITPVGAYADTLTVNSSGHAWLADCVNNDIGTTINQGSGTTKRQATASWAIGDSNGFVSSGSHSLNWASGSGTGDWWSNIISFLPATATVGGALSYSYWF